MMVSVVAIGNSKGIRLPKKILEQLDITDTLELDVENKRIILTPVPSVPRNGWDNEFRHMHNERQDSPLIPDLNDDEAFEWEW